MNCEDMFEKAALVVAHPDDEALWFSSVLGGVEQVVICFMDVPSRPDWSEGRRKSSASFPMDNAVFLGLTESEVFDCADWKKPFLTEYGMEVFRRKGCSPCFSVRRYRENRIELEKRLRDRLRGSRNVITHNPWGEYGHEEHVQVFLTIRKLQSELGFALWFSNYCSNRSHNLMLRHINGFGSGYVTREVDLGRGRELMELYRKNNCWTWYEDYVFFRQECFMAWDASRDRGKREGHIFPLNYIRVDCPHVEYRIVDTEAIRRKVARKLRRVAGISDE